MKTQKTDKPQELPRSISDAAWERFWFPFLKACPNIYVGGALQTLPLCASLDNKDEPPGVLYLKSTGIGT